MRDLQDSTGMNEERIVMHQDANESSRLVGFTCDEREVERTQTMIKLEQESKTKRRKRKYETLIAILIFLIQQPELIPANSTQILVPSQVDKSAVIYGAKSSHSNETQDSTKQPERASDSSIAHYFSHSDLHDSDRLIRRPIDPPRWDSKGWRPRLAEPQNRAPQSSSLRPKHVSPPAHFMERPRGEAPIREPDSLSIGQPLEPAKQEAELQARLVAARLRQQSLSAGSSQLRRPVGKLSPARTKTLRLIPRLAAKIFKQEQQVDPLSGLSSFHAPLYDSRPAQNLQADSRAPLRAARLVKNLLDYRLPLSTPPDPSERPAQRHPSRPAESALVLLNGRLYTLLNPRRPEVAANLVPLEQLANPPTANSDHQTSDTREFPIFEAMSMQHMSSPATPTFSQIPTLDSSGSSSGGRCDKPRHVIQADRSVVDYILQSQQNFVIARVPIKKFIRPEVAPAPSHVYHAFPVPIMAAMNVPASLPPPQPAPGPLVMQTAPAVQNFAYDSSVRSQFPPTIELAASVVRPSIWRSLASLVQNIRVRARPAAQTATLITPAGSGEIQSPTSPSPAFGMASSPSAVLLDGSIILARRNSIDTSEPRQSPASPDPLQRMLMLKTASDNEVCMPIGELGNKIRYSCVPNYCVTPGSNGNSANMATLNSHVNSHSSYQTSGSSMSLNSKRNPLRNLTTNFDPTSQIQVQQFDDQPTNSPYVTYTHLNAYEAPEISRLLQPHREQHLHHSFNTLAHNETYFEPDPDSRVTYFDRPDSSNYNEQTNRPSLTFGTAYVMSTDRPSTPRLRKALKTTSSSVLTARPQVNLDDKFDNNSNDFGGITLNNGPNQFVSAVDEQLERPIRTSWGQAEKRIRTRLRERPSERFALRPQQMRRTSDRNRVLEVISSVGKSTETPSNSDESLPDDEDGEPEEEPPIAGQPEDKQVEPTNGLNVSKTIPVLDGPIHEPEAAVLRERKTRRDMKASGNGNVTDSLVRYGNGSSQPEESEISGYNYSRYGLRQASSLPPPPEKSTQNSDDSSLAYHEDDNSFSNHMTNGSLPQDCDCQREKQVEKELDPEERLTAPRLDSSLPVERKPVELAKLDRRQTNGNSTRQQQPTTTTTTTQTTSTRTQTNGKRPYELRNTTYKNLLANGDTNGINVAQWSNQRNGSSHLSEVAAISPVTTATEFPTVRQKSYVSPDMSTTRATPTARRNKTSAWDRDSEAGNYLTQFDDSNEQNLDQNATWTQRDGEPNQTTARHLRRPKWTQKEEPARHRAGFRPSSVNDIVAKARHEKSRREEPAKLEAAVSQVRELTKPSTMGRVRRILAHPNETEDEEREEDEEENQVTPHQYQIQLRWSNSSSRIPLENESADSRIGISRHKGGSPVGGGRAEVDRMREQVRDRLFEHRDEEHWHEKSWLRAKRRGQRLVDGRLLTQEEAARPAVNPASVDYGPHARERLTPVRDQLSNWPTEGETERHFAIPTHNFRQSPKFVEWVQRDVDLSSEI